MRSKENKMIKKKSCNNKRQIKWLNYNKKNNQKKRKDKKKNIIGNN